MLMFPYETKTTGASMSNLITKSMIRAIRKECREVAHMLTREDYRLYDAIWTDRIYIDSALMDHGRETIRDINRMMPNLLSHNPAVSPIDVVAERYGFPDTSSLIEYLLAYTPRGQVEEKYFESLFESRLKETESCLQDVPF